MKVLNLEYDEKRSEKYVPLDEWARLSPSEIMRSIYVGSYVLRAKLKDERPNRKKLNNLMSFILTILREFLDAWDFYETNL